MSHFPLAWANHDDSVGVKHVSPFWCVLLAGRDSSEMVNMHAYMEEYNVPQPVGKNTARLLVHRA